MSESSLHQEAAAAKQPQSQATPPPLSPEIISKLNSLRDYVRDAFGSVVMAMMGLPRYRHLSIGDLQHLVLDPLIRDRIAIAKSANTEGSRLDDVAGFAIWASVSENVDTKIRDQIKAGVFPVRLKPEDWASGEINWIFDIIAPDRKSAGRVIANFKQVVKDGELRLHPQVIDLIGKDELDRIAPSKNDKVE